MRKRFLSLLQYVIFLGAGLFLVWWQLKSMTAVERQEFYAAFKHTKYWLMVPVVFMSLLSHLSRSMRWKLLMEQLGYRPSTRNVFCVTMVGYLANAAIPRLGEVLKCSFLARYEKFKIDKLFGTILVERAFDLFCYLIFIGITILLQINIIGGYLRQKLEGFAQAKGFPIWAKLAVAVAVLFVIFYGLRWLARRFPHNRIVVKLNGFVKGVSDGFKTIKQLRKRSQFVAHTVFIWAMYLLQIYLGFFAMDGTNDLDIRAAFSVLALATLAMIITPGGIGSFPIFVMETLVMYAITEPVGKAFGWLIWGANTAIVIVAGLVSLLLLPFFNKTHHKPEPNAMTTG